MRAVSLLRPRTLRILPSSWLAADQLWLLMKRGPLTTHEERHLDEIALTPGFRRVLGEHLAVNGRKELVVVLERGIVQLADVEGAEAVEVGTAGLVQKFGVVLVVDGIDVVSAGEIVKRTRLDDRWRSAQVKDRQR